MLRNFSMSRRHTWYQEHKTWPRRRQDVCITHIKCAHNIFFAPAKIIFFGVFWAWRYLKSKMFASSVVRERPFCIIRLVTTLGENQVVR